MHLMHLLSSFELFFRLKCLKTSILSHSSIVHPLTILGSELDVIQNVLFLNSLLDHLLYSFLKDSLIWLVEVSILAL